MKTGGTRSWWLITEEAGCGNKTTTPPLSIVSSKASVYDLGGGFGKAMESSAQRRRQMTRMARLALGETMPERQPPRSAELSHVCRTALAAVRDLDAARAHAPPDVLCTHDESRRSHMGGWLTDA